MAKRIVELNQNFNRKIMEYFMSKEQLKELDKQYNLAKVTRLLERATGRQLKELKGMLKELTEI